MILHYVCFLASAILISFTYLIVDTAPVAVVASVLTVAVALRLVAATTGHVPHPTRSLR